MASTLKTSITLGLDDRYMVILHNRSDLNHVISIEQRGQMKMEIANYRRENTPIDQDSSAKKTPFNWPVVGFLLFMTAIPAIPAFFLIALVLLGSSAIEGVSSTIDPLHFTTPAAVIIHGGSGILFFLTMPFQFSPSLREKKENWHKKGGYVAVLSGYVMAISGIWLHHVLFPDIFGMRYVSLVIVSAGMCIAFSVALFCIIQRNIHSHIQWMCRAVAISLAIVTPIFLEIPIFLMLGQLDEILRLASQFMHNYDRLLGMGINLMLVEYIFYKRLRQAGMPK